MAPNPSSTTTPIAAVKNTPWLLYGFAALLGLLLVIVATVGITLWWLQRPIKPVVLSAPEQTAVEEKLQHLGSSSTVAPASNRGTAVGAAVAPPEDRPYVPGSKVLTLTEREINGLLNANTDLGKSVRLEFARDAINAYVVVPIPEDFPVGGGKMFRARGRFRLSFEDGAAPTAILEDFTVFGLSLPKAWLGGLKGENLIGEALGKHNGTPIFNGIKNLRIEPGAIVLEVAD